MSRQSRELKKQQKRARKCGCDGKCYWSTGVCQNIGICEATKEKTIAATIEVIWTMILTALAPVVGIGGTAMLIWMLWMIITH
uniref:Uncharacterized protein n=1 Tax=Caudovirales sp. ctIsq18 TaxID=2825762 RepID=A0A8S5PNQ5_9CAUD|nr:MAG TPA: hypothetical protein [Caudovirales sp. ctIsq18]